MQHLHAARELVHTGNADGSDGYRGQDWRQGVPHTGRPAVATASLIEQLARRTQNLCFTKELAPVQWSALRFLAKAGASARTVSGLAAYSGVNQSSASRTIQLLADKKLVEVGIDTEDARIRLVSLTSAGRELLERDPLFALAAAVERLDPTEQVALRDTLAKVIFELHPRPFSDEPG
jgi:DNA-binding MarR family transcriptional regulator